MTNQAEITTLITGWTDDLGFKKLVAEAARMARTEYCSWCTQHGGSNGMPCRSNGVHYCRVLAAHAAGTIGATHLLAAQVALGSPAPHREMLLVFEPWQALTTDTAV